MNRPKSICLVAGEPSGDLHGSLLVAELKRRHPEWSIWGVGSDRMAAAGCELWQDARGWAVMGFAEVFRSLLKFRKRLHDLRREIRKRRPDCVILIDFPGFNLKLAQRAHRDQIPVVYYIVPQLWAWGQGRIKIFQKCIDRTIVVFPFEQEFFKHYGVDADWIGHPFIDLVHPSASRDVLRQKLGVDSTQRLVALMPGVRVQDLNAHLPLFTEALKLVAESVPGVCGSIGVHRSLSETTTPLSAGPVSLSMTPDVYDLMAAADVVLTKTGTTTVECAILGTPMVTAYRTGSVNYTIAKSLVKVPYVAMPNLIAKRRVVPELVQAAASPDALAREVIALLTDDSLRQRQLQGLAEVREKLGPPGAVQRGADVIEQWLSGRK
ncbi:MAG: lipid-A-disaccharide synthase [candidate division Zixibacteria bacterium]|nr:lipid-A-disaccharide synthase [candidate division Zixibacteria bacterium]